MKWHPIKLWNLTLAIKNGGLKWWTDPSTNRFVLKARDGSVYDYCRTKFGCAIRKRYQLSE